MSDNKIEKWKYDLLECIYKKETSRKDMALEEAVRAIYLDKKEDFGDYLWTIIRILGGPEAISFLETNRKLAYYIYCKGDI